MLLQMLAKRASSSVLLNRSSTFRSNQSKRAERSPKRCEAVLAVPSSNKVLDAVMISACEKGEQAGSAQNSVETELQPEQEISACEKDRQAERAFDDSLFDNGLKVKK